MLGNAVKLKKKSKTWRIWDRQKYSGVHQTQLRSAALDKSSKQTIVKIHQYGGKIKNGQTRGEKIRDKQGQRATELG